MLCQWFKKPVGHFQMDDLNLCIPDSESPNLVIYDLGLFLEASQMYTSFPITMTPSGENLPEITMLSRLAANIWPSSPFGFLYNLENLLKDTSLGSKEYKHMIFGLCDTRTIYFLTYFLHSQWGSSMDRWPPRERTQELAKCWRSQMVWIWKGSSCSSNARSLCLE